MYVCGIDEVDVDDVGEVDEDDVDDLDDVDEVRIEYRWCGGCMWCRCR
jgi:hypothetical protein